MEAESKLQKNPTKVLIFNGNKKDYKNVFYLGKLKLDNVESYKYLGIIFHLSNRLTKARNMLYIQAEKAMYFVLRQGRYHNISIQCQLKLFDSMVLPVLLYGSEIWGFEKISLMEKICNTFLKLLLPVRKTAPSYLLYGELGRFPVHISVKLRMIAFWFRLLSGKQSKLSLLVYNLLLNMNNYVYNHKWLLFVKAF